MTTFEFGPMRRKRQQLSHEECEAIELARMKKQLPTNDITPKDN